MRFFYALIFTLASSMAVFGANPTLQSFENPDFIVDTNSPPLNGPTNVIHTALQAHAPSTPGDQYYLTINGTNISAGFLNPTPTFVPYRGATNFLDSQIAQQDPVTVKIGTNFTFATTGVGRLTIEQPNASSGSIVLYDYAGPSQQTIYPNGLGLVPTHNGYYTVTSENTFLNGIKFLFRTEQPYMMVSSNRNVVIGKNDVTSANRTTNYLYIPFGNGTPIGTPVLEGSHPAMYWDSSGDLLYIWSPPTGWHIIGTNIFFGTNNFAINPTDGAVSYRVNATTLGDSPFRVQSTERLGFNSATIPWLWQSGNDSLAIGNRAMEVNINTTDSVAVGGRAMGNSADTADYNVAVGESAGRYLQGINSVLIGRHNNPGLGSMTNSYNTFIGADIGVFLADIVSDATTNSTSIGYRALNHSTNTVNLGNEYINDLWVGTNHVSFSGGVPTALNWTNDLTLGAFRPVDLTLPIMATNKMYLSAGKTNDLFTVARNLYYYSPDESSLVLSNATTSMSVGISGGNARISSLIGLTQLGDAVTQTKKLVSSTDGVDDIGQNGNLGSYHDLYIKGKAHVTDQEDGAGNYSKMDVSTSGGIGIFDYRSAGTGTVFSKFSFRSNGVEVGTFPGSGGAVSYAQVTNALALTGSTTTYLRSDGTQATPPGGGGGGNMTNSGPSVAGMIATATDTTGTQWTATNGVPSLEAGTLNVTGTMQVAITNQVLATDGSGNVVGESRLWTNLPSLTDMEGGTVYGSGYLNPQSIRVQIAENYLTNFFGEPSISLSIGNASADPMVMAQNGANVFNIGYHSGEGMTVTNVYDVYNIGDANSRTLSLFKSDDVYTFGDNNANNVYGTNVVDIFGIGYGNLTGAKLDGPFDIYALGNQCFVNAKLTNCNNLYAIGQRAGYAMTLTSCTDIYSIGLYANQSLTGTGLSHMFALGSNAVCTNSNDFVIGDSAYNYFFPGASAQFDNAVKVGTSTTWKLGAIKTCSAVTIVLTNYIEVVINGTTNAIPLITVTP